MPSDHEQQTAPEQTPPPNVDDLIAQANAATYVFEHQKQRWSPKQWFLGLSKTRKILVVGGTAFLVFTIGVITLTMASSETTLPGGSSQNSAVATTDTNGDGVIDENDDSTVIQGDTNGDGVVDSRDDTASNTTDETSSSWWSSLFAKAQSALKKNGGSASSDETDSTESGSSYTSTEDSYFPSDSSYYDDEVYDFDETTDENTSYTPDKVVVSKGTSVTIGSWNILKYDNSVKNMKAGVKEIFSEGATVIGLQEVDDPSFSAKSVTSIGSDTIGTYSPGEGTAIVWDKRKVEKLAAESFRPISSKGKRFSYAKFKLRSNGQQFYVLNLHMQPGANGASEGCGSTNCKNYKAQMKTLVAKLKQLQKHKLPIIVVGDYNVDYRQDSKCRVSWYPCKALGEIDMMSAYKALKLKNTSGSAKKYIDQAYFWTATTAKTVPVANAILGTGSSCKQSKVRDIDGDVVIHCWHGSDHKPILFTAKLGSS